MEPERAEIVAAARALVGARWAHLARSPLEVDCIGLGVLAYRAAGIETEPAPPSYSRLPNPDQLRAGLEKSGFVDLGPGWPPLPADVVSFRMGSPNVETHLGLFVGSSPALGWSMVHAYLRGRIVQETGLGALWGKRLASVWRHRRFVLP